MDMNHPAFALPKGQPAPVRRAQKRAQDEAALRECYADVDRRDGGICQATGRHTVPGSPDARVRREHHHLVKRSHSTALRAEPSNVVTLCAEAHQLVEAGLLVLEGTDATKPLFCHWAAHAPTPRPFQLKGKRGSGR